MNFCTAKVGDGASSATFCVRLPRWSTDSRINSRCVGRVLTLEGCLPKVKKARISLSLSLKRQRNTYPFRLRTPFADGKTVGGFDSTIAIHFTNAAKAFPLASEDVVFRHDPTNPANQRMELVLPPFSALYTTFEDFFPAFRFKGQNYDERSIGGRGARAMTKKVFGFFNNTKAPMRLESTSILTTDQQMNVLLELVVKQRTGIWNDAFAPNNVQLQVEVGDQPVAKFVAEKVVDVTLDGVTAAFESIMDKARADMNLSQRVIMVHSTSEGAVSLCNHVVPERVPDYGSTVMVTLPKPIATLLGLPNEMTFPMDTVKYYPMKVRSLLTDPFAGLYPVLVVARALSGRHPLVCGAAGRSGRAGPLETRRQDAALAGPNV